MLTIEQVIEYMEHIIAQERLTGDAIGLRQVQTAAGVLKAAAEYAGDKDTAYRFRVVAAHAANRQEEREQD